MNLNMASIIDDSESNTDPDKAHSTLETFDEQTFDKETARKDTTLESSTDSQIGKYEEPAPKVGKYMRYETRA